MVTIPAPFVIQREQKQIGLFQNIEHGLATCLFPHGIAEWAAEALQDAGVQEEVLDSCWLLVEHFFQQIVHYIAMAAAERRDEADRIVMTLQGVGCQLQSGNP